MPVFRREDLKPFLTIFSAKDIEEVKIEEPRFESDVGSDLKFDKPGMMHVSQVE